MHAEYLSCHSIGAELGLACQLAILQKEALFSQGTDEKGGLRLGRSLRNKIGSKQRLLRVHVIKCVGNHTKKMH